jgi:hypothetical protein
MFCVLAPIPHPPRRNGSLAQPVREGSSVRPRQGRLGALSVFHSKSFLYGFFFVGAQGAQQPKTVVSGPGSRALARPSTRTPPGTASSGAARPPWPRDCQYRSDTLLPLESPRDLAHVTYRRPALAERVLPPQVRGQRRRARAHRAAAALLGSHHRGARPARARDLRLDLISA